MEEIKVGEYVRTVDGIRKIVKINTGKDKTIFGTYILDKKYKGSFSIAEKNILKHSDFLGELIEVGDYINGFIVEEKWEDADHFRFESCDYCHNIDDSEIRCVVTKEQLEKMRYKVGD